MIKIASYIYKFKIDKKGTTNHVSIRKMIKKCSKSLVIQEIKIKTIK